MRAAVVAVMPGSARAVSTAAVILATSFGLLALVPLRPFGEIAFAMSVGVLLDALLVRSLLMPALLALLGDLSGWPRRRLGSMPAGESGGTARMLGTMRRPAVRPGPSRTARPIIGVATGEAGQQERQREMTPHTIAAISGDGTVTLAGLAPARSGKPVKAFRGSLLALGVAAVVATYLVRLLRRRGD